MFGYRSLPTDCPVSCPKAMLFHSGDPRRRTTDHMQVIPVKRETASSSIPHGESIRTPHAGFGTCVEISDIIKPHGVVPIRFTTGTDLKGVVSFLNTTEGDVSLQVLT